MKDQMRDRLIELIKQAKKHTKDANTDIGRNMIFADYLLENGVIVPPINIGQELWDIHYKKPRKWEVCYLGFNGEEWFINLQYFKNRHDFATRQTSSKFIGKLFYFSKEEAEQSLKGGEG